MNKSAMRRSVCSVVFVGLLALLAGCTAPLVLPDDEEKKDSTDVNPSGIDYDSIQVVSLGTRTDPYSVLEAWKVAPASDVWVEGIVVGFVKGTSASASAVFSLSDKSAIKQSNLLLADTLTTDYRRCIAIRLANGSEERSELNLYENPSVMHQRLKVHGNLTQYLSITGVYEVEEFVLGNDDNPEENQGNGNDNPQNPNENPSDSPFRANTIDEPVSVAEVVAYVDSMQTLLRVERSYSDEVWVTGYIVGYYNKSPQFDKTGYEFNVMLADSAALTEKNQIVVVKLTKGEVRDAVNLKDNPANLYRHLTIHGRVNEEYGELPSLDNVAESATYANGSPTYRLWN
ncbi:MAG: hypothetical protein J5814_01360 [Bacteroidaceae bacterium]|nr:hypothetical protein [Bacteroidaceae bacterium]